MVDRDVLDDNGSGMVSILIASVDFGPMEFVEMIEFVGLAAAELIESEDPAAAEPKKFAEPKGFAGSAG